MNACLHMNNTYIYIHKLHVGLRGGTGKKDQCLRSTNGWTYPIVVLYETISMYKEVGLEYVDMYVCNCKFVYIYNYISTVKQ